MAISTSVWGVQHPIAGQNIQHFFSTLRKLAVHRKDLILVGPLKDNPESDPLAILHLDNQL